MPKTQRFVTLYLTILFMLYSMFLAWLYFLLFHKHRINQVFYKAFFIKSDQIVFFFAHS